VELILQFEPVEQVDESHVNVAEGPTAKLGHGLFGAIGDVVAPG